MIELLLLQARLVTQWLWQLLRRLGHQLIAIGIAVLLPLGLMLGLIVSPERNGKPLTLQQPPLVNLLHLLPLVPYREVPQVNATDRRGAMAEKRTGCDRSGELSAPPLVTPESVLLPGFLLIQLDVMPQTVWTVLPHWSNPGLSKPLDGLEPEITVQPLWMYS